MNIKALLRRCTGIKIKTLMLTLMTCILVAMIGINLLLRHFSMLELRNQAQIHFSGICEQLEQSINLSYGNMLGAVERFVNNRDLQDYLTGEYDDTLHRAYTENLQNISQISPAVVAVKVYSGNFTLSSTTDATAAFTLMQTDFLSDLDALTAAYHTPFFEDYGHRSMYCAYLQPIYSTKASNFHERLGAIAVVMDLSKVLNTSMMDPLFPNTALIVTDADQSRFYNPNHMDDPAAIQHQLDQTSDDLQQLSIGGEDYYAITIRVGLPAWQLTIMLPAGDLFRNGASIVALSSAITFTCVLLTILLSGLILLNLLYPIHRISRDMLRIRSGDFSQRVQAVSHNEIGLLAHDINSMLSEINHLTSLQLQTQNDLYALKFSEQQSQLLMLQSQINPHFLYNTLECIQGIALDGRPREIMRITAAMAHIYRYACAKDSMVPLQRELECVQHYLTIMHTRFGRLTALTMDIPEEVKGILMPRMILQPLVENAYGHGLEMDSGKGFLALRAALDGEALVLSLENSGSQLTPEQAEDINRQLNESAAAYAETRINNGLALANISRRLYLMYKKANGIVLSVPRQGVVRVTVRIG